MDKVAHFKRRKRKPGGALILAFALVGAAAAGYYGPDLLPGLVAKLVSSSTIVATRSPAASGDASSSSHTLTGRASVIDGDTINIHGERIRFNGIDAPETAQTCQNGSNKTYRCGARAAAALADFLSAASPTRCEFVERDQYGRFVGDCFRSDDESVQAWLVRSGWAMDWPRYSDGKYSREQQNAKAARLGIWVGLVQPPWEWRADQRQQEAEVRPAPIAPLVSKSVSGGCKIKGNISSKGERIFHKPGQQHYARTVISESKGERWFCSEAEARSAGWRAAKR